MYGTKHVLVSLSTEFNSRYHTARPIPAILTLFQSSHFLLL